MNPNINKKLNSFHRFSGITVVAVFFLILVGGIVRSTGSGMGCPDWPACFGSVIPPTSVDQLPANYQEIYLEKRLAKNERFVAILDNLGFHESAHQLATDKSIQVEEEFNAAKTWIEYINRLIGVVIGILIVFTCYKSFSLWSVDKWIPLASFLAVVVVVFTGWIGSIVVSTNLLPGIITFHMLLALLLVCIILFGQFRAERILAPTKQRRSIPKKVFWGLLLGMLAMLVQVMLGTQVREAIDSVAFSLGNFLREEWVERTGLVFLIHRSFSLFLLLIHGLYFRWAFQYIPRGSSLHFWNFVLGILVLVEIATGMGMAYFGIPAYLQPIHLLVGSVILGIQFFLIVRIKEQTERKEIFTHS